MKLCKTVYSACVLAADAVTPQPADRAEPNQNKKCGMKTQEQQAAHLSL